MSGSVMVVVGGVLVWPSCSHHHGRTDPSPHPTTRHTTQSNPKQIDATVQGLDSLPPHVLPSLDLYDPEAQRLLRICNWQAYLRDPPPEGDEAGCGCS